jgi:hypothetical protein
MDLTYFFCWLLNQVFWWIINKVFCQFGGKWNVILIYSCFMWPIFMGQLTYLIKTRVSSTKWVTLTHLVDEMNTNQKTGFFLDLYFIEGCQITTWGNYKLNLSNLQFIELCVMKKFLQILLYPISLFDKNVGSARGVGWRGMGLIRTNIWVPLWVDIY